jgi:hypothetical protein
MTPVFHINFRREAYEREMVRSRARVIGLGVWLTYFGVIAVVSGLYGLNCVAVQRRTGLIERQTAALRAHRSDQVDWTRQRAEMALVQRGVDDSRAWSARLARVPGVLPNNVRLTSIEFNPASVSGGGDWDRLVVAGVLHAAPDQDRMRGVSELVRRFQRDSLLAAHYRNIRLATTRVSDPAGGNAEFVIECRP